MQHVLLITGSMGSGKTTILGEASDLLAGTRIVHGCVDLDWLAHVHGGNPEGLLERNLSAVCANFRALGIDRLLVAGAVESRNDLQRLADAAGTSRITVARLRAPVAQMEARLALRERGIYAARYRDRVGELERILDAAAIEDFSVETDGVSVTEVAREVLRRADWVSE